MNAVCHLDGRFLPLSEARISPMDRGFLFADGGYEVIPVYSRQPFRLDQHLARLGNTLAGLEIADPHPPARWRELVHEVIARNEWDDQSVYVQVTRGREARRNHGFSPDLAATVFLMSEALVTVPEEQREAGVGAITAADFRWLRCDLKTIALLANCLLRNHALKAGCAEAVLLRDGFLTEGSASNIFIVRDGVMLAPPKSHLMLPGITYDVVLELAAANAPRGAGNPRAGIALCGRNLADFVHQGGAADHAPRRPSGRRRPPGSGGAEDDRLVPGVQGEGNASWLTEIPNR